jgi:hypothetical protein
VVGADINDEIAVALVLVLVPGGGGLLKVDMAKQVKAWDGASSFYKALDGGGSRERYEAL